MRNVLVLGGSGFIGQNLCSLLKQKGDNVYSFDRTNPDVQDTDINYIEGDFFDDVVLESITKNMDIVYHAISTINPGNSQERYMSAYQNDFIQSIKLCNLVMKNDAKLIFLSSGGTVYGNQEIQPIPETATTHPINHYGALKLCIENVIRTFNIYNEEKMLIARISNPYGPGQDYKKGVGFIDATLKSAINNTELSVFGDGSIIRDYIYIDDVVNCLYDLSFYNGAFDIFNISTAKGVSQNDVINEVKKYYPEMNIRYAPTRRVDLKSNVLDNSRILDVYKKDMVCLCDGIKKYLDYLMQQKD